MDPFTHLNYRYPGSSDAARPCVSQQSHDFPHYVVQNIQSVQNQTPPGNGYIYSESSTITQPRPSLDLTTGHGLHPQKSIPISPRGVVQPDPTGPTETYYTGESANLSDQYIPSSSDKITCTDHRPLDEIFGNIRPPSGWPPAKSGSVYPPRSETPRGHPRHSSVLTYPLPTKPQLDGVVQIPLLAVDNQMSGTGLIIDFRCSDWGIGVELEGVLPHVILPPRVPETLNKGIQMLDLLHDNVSGLENPYERVLDGFGLTDLRLNILVRPLPRRVRYPIPYRLQWPQNPPFAKVISAFGRDGKPITRAQLGYEVAFAFAEFFYVRSAPPFYTQSVLTAHTRSSPAPCGVADNVTVHPRVIWTLRHCLNAPRVVVPRNQVLPATFDRG